MRIATLRKLIFAIPLCKMFSFPTLDIHSQTQKPLEKEAWKQAYKNTHCFVQGTQEAIKMESEKLSKIIKKPSLDLEVSFLCSRMSQDRPRVPQDAKMEAASMLNWRHQACPKNIKKIAKMLRIHNLRTVSSGQGPAAEGVAP